MNQATLLVTSDGKRVLPENDEFFATLSRLAPGDEPGGFAVKNLGFVRLRPQGRVTVIELHPMSVDRRALFAAERWIGQAAAQRFQFHYLDGARPSPAVLSAGEAVAELRALHPAPLPMGAERFRVEPQDFSRLLRDRTNPLRLIIRKWRASFGAFDETVLPFAADNGLSAQLTVARVPGRGAPPVLHYIGSGFPWLGPDDRNRVIGAGFDSFPDKQYGAWASDFFRWVALSGEPRFDRVTARLRNAATGQPYLARYERVLLPWRTAAGETLVSAAARRVGGAAAA